MITMTHQERKVFLFLCFLLALGLFVTQYRKATGCNTCLIDVYRVSSEGSVRVDLNQATLPELIAVPGIGEKTAEAILKVRSLKGRFDRIEDLKAIRGIADKKIEELGKYLFVT